MGQFNWTYLGDHGKKFKVGLFHGERTGHLLIHCNSKIVQVDFGVRQSTTYSFFLDEELCEIELERKGNKFYYRFNINKEVDTPRNRARKKIERKHWKQSLLFFGALLICAGLFSFLFISMKSKGELNERATLLETTGQETLAKVFLSEKDSDDLKFKYSFVGNGRSIQSDWIPMESSLLSSGMPLESGDEFIVRFAQNRPHIHEIKLDQPSENQLNNYFQKVFNQHQQLHPDLSFSKIRCLVSIAYELNGIPGLADFYFQEASEEINPTHNLNSYLRLTRDVPFQKKSEETCF